MRADPDRDGAPHRWFGVGMKRLCLGPTPGRRCPYRAIVTQGRCPPCAQSRERERGTTTQRGYGVQHQRVRVALGDILSAPCGYCGTTIVKGEPFVAAHVVDGQPEHGWMHAHALCNARARQGGRVDT
jgi:hypothetical protein